MSASDLMDRRVRRKSKKKRRIGSTCIELNRSLALFCIISKILFYVAAIMLYSTNFDPIYHLLLIREDQAPSMETIPQGILLMELTGFSVNVLTAVGGLYGYARLSRYVLTYYLVTIMLQIVWNVYLPLIFLSRDDTDHARKKLFLQFKYSKQARSAVAALQFNFHCCGSVYYRYHDLPAFPRTCCREDYYGCPESEIWPLCETNRTTIYSGYLQSDKLGTVAQSWVVSFWANIAELILLLIMLFQLNRKFQTGLNSMS